MSVSDKVQELSTLGTDAITKLSGITTFVNNDMKRIMKPEIWALYNKDGYTADTISAISNDLQAEVTLSEAHYRKIGSYVLMDGIVDNGLLSLNGRHKIIDISDDNKTFTFDVNTEDADSYTSGGTMFEISVADIEYAEAALCLYYLIPAVKDIKVGDFDVIAPKVRAWGEGNVSISSIGDLNAIRRWFYNYAIRIISYYNGGGEGGGVSFYAI